MQLTLNTDTHYFAFAHEIGDMYSAGELDIFMCDYFTDDDPDDISWVIGWELENGERGRSVDITVLTREAARWMNA